MHEYEWRLPGTPTDIMVTLSPLGATVIERTIRKACSQQDVPSRGAVDGFYIGSIF